MSEIPNVMQDEKGKGFKAETEIEDENDNDTEPEVKDISAEEFLALTGREIYHVDLPNGKGRFYYRSVTTMEKDQMELRLRNVPRGKRNPRGALLHLIAVDRNGKQLFSLKQAERIAKVNAQYCDVVLNDAMPRIGYTESDIEKMEKN